MIPIAFIKYLYHFHVDRDYFECHEILEEFWKKETDQQKNSVWVGFILLAVANYHHRRNNLSGASRTLQKALTIFMNQRREVETLGFKVIDFYELLENHLKRLKENKDYQSYSLPIKINKNQLEKCFSEREIANMNWGQKSDLSNIEIIHRHALRDRSDVIAERKKALLERNKNKPE
ncbi:DUF309 domain-containing protein [Pseudoneobacillus sp. C159]